MIWTPSASTPHVGDKIPPEHYRAAIAHLKAAGVSLRHVVRPGPFGADGWPHYFVVTYRQDVPTPTPRERVPDDDDAGPEAA